MFSEKWKKSSFGRHLPPERDDGRVCPEKEVFWRDIVAFFTPVGAALATVIAFHVIAPENSTCLGCDNRFISTLLGVITFFLARLSMVSMGTDAGKRKKKR